MTTLRQSLQESIARLKDDPRPGAQRLLKDYQNQLPEYNATGSKSAQSLYLSGSLSQPSSASSQTSGTPEAITKKEK